MIIFTPLSVGTVGFVFIIAAQSLLLQVFHFCQAAYPTLYPIGKLETEKHFVNFIEKKTNILLLGVLCQQHVQAFSYTYKCWATYISLSTDLKQDQRLHPQKWLLENSESCMKKKNVFRAKKIKFIMIGKKILPSSLIRKKNCFHLQDIFKLHPLLEHIPHVNCKSSVIQTLEISHLIFKLYIYILSHTDRPTKGSKYTKDKFWTSSHVCIALSKLF